MKNIPSICEVHSGPGFRIRSQIQRPTQSIVDAYREFATPDLSDLMNRFYTMHHRVSCMTEETPLIGPACTVKVYPGDNLMVHKALTIAQPGDVIVVDSNKASRNGIIGDMIANKAKHLGISGFVIDGLVRDIAGIRSCGLPVYACGSTPQGPLQRGPGEINFPVSCAGVVVQPGDLICGDGNGIVVVPRDFTEELLERLTLRQEEMERYASAVRAGSFSYDWVDELLSDTCCQKID